MTYLRRTLLLEFVILMILTIGAVNTRFPFISSLLAPLTQFARILESFPTIRASSSLALLILLTSVLVLWAMQHKHHEAQIDVSRVFFLRARDVSLVLIGFILIVFAILAFAYVVSWTSFPYSGLVTWVGRLSAESKIFLSAAIPSATTAILAYFVITKMQRVRDDIQWSGFESIIRQMNPAVDIPLTLFSLVGLLVAWQTFPLFIRSLVIWLFATAMIALALAISNWYVTSLLFTHQAYTVNQERVTLVDNHRDRKIAWLLLNGFVILVAWVFWIVAVISWRLILG